MGRGGVRRLGGGGVGVQGGWGTTQARRARRWGRWISGRTQPRRCGVARLGRSCRRLRGGGPRRGGGGLYGRPRAGGGTWLGLAGSRRSGRPGRVKTAGGGEAAPPCRGRRPLPFQAPRRVAG